MTYRASITRWLGSAGRWPHLWLVPAAAFLFLVGCTAPESFLRAKSEDDSEQQRYDVQTIGDFTTVGNAEPVPVGGVGLVEGLEGTGGDCNHDAYRTMLLDQLTKERVPNAPALLKSPECALVILEGSIPPGANKNDKIDIEVKLPPGSQATSLRGGILRKCYLFNYDFHRNLSPKFQDSNSMLLGHRLVVAQGPVLVGFGEGDEEARLKSGRIWAGGRLLRDQPLSLIMNPDKQQGRFTSLIADRINHTFQTSGLRGALDTSIAHTSNELAVTIRVPFQYRHNLPRYLRVVRSIPLTDSADMPGKTESDRRSYRQKLADDLVDPSRAVVAALRLEALGSKSIPIFKDKGLKSEHPLVRFVSAEALAYLGSPACGEELHNIAIKYPMLRAYALTALASLDEAISHLKLKELIVSNHDDELRYGAFLALRLLNERDELVRGEHLNEAFWLHRVGPDTKPLIHISTTKRAEIVLFGESPRLKPPFSILAGEFAITATEDDTRCTVSRFPIRGEPVRRQCSLQLDAVLRTMADLGGQYPEVLALIQQAATCDGLSCRVRVDAVPQAPSVHELAKAGTNLSELVPAGQDLGKTPNLYQVGLPLE